MKRKLRANFDGGEARWDVPLPRNYAPNDASAKRPVPALRGILPGIEEIIYNAACGRLGVCGRVFEACWAVCSYDGMGNRESDRGSVVVIT